MGKPGAMTEMRRHAQNLSFRPRTGQNGFRAAYFGPCSRGAGTEVIARYQLPMVGVPDPTAIANTCNAVIPLPAPALTVGSVTEATVLPACSGTDAK